MRILIANELGAVVGGRETYLRMVAPLLRAAGHEVGFAFELAAAAGQTPVAVVGTGPVWWLPDDLAAVAAWQPDVLYLHGLASPETESTLAGRHPTVYFPHGYYGTCISGQKRHLWPGTQACTRVLGPGCLVAYLPRQCGGRNPFTMIGLYRTQRRRQAMLDQYRTVVVASRHMAAEYCRHGVPDARLRVLPLFPTNAAPDPTPPTTRPRSDRVLFVGRITELKGLPHLVEALRAAATELSRPLTLVVAGDGPDRAAVEAKAQRLGVPTEFLGWVDPERRNAEMRWADVLAVPSIWPEPFGLVGLEAGCVGLPAVGYAAGGVPDWLEPGVSGESAPGDRPDPGELALALVRALGDDAHLRRLGAGAWETARRFSVEAHIERLVPILEECTHGNR